MRVLGDDGQVLPRVTHFNDCAMVGQRLVEAAARAGLDWNYLPPQLVRPPQGFGASGVGRLSQMPFVVRHWNMLRTSDVIHIHYATAHHLLQHRYLPRRPYVLHLHGSDIRRQWKQPATHDMIQRAIDGAHTVFYANLDNAADAASARSDARYMPAPMDISELPEWSPSVRDGYRRIVFASRWDDSKGVETQLDLAAKLRSAHPPEVDIVGLDWGPGADRAKAAGVRLVPRLPHAEYLEFLASADMVMGQAAGILGISELEAIAIGPVVACPVVSDFFEKHAPIIQGSVAEVIEASVEIMRDPRAASQQMAALPWIVEYHSADLRVPMLEAIYREAAGL